MTNSGDIPVVLSPSHAPANAERVEQISSLGSGPAASGTIPVKLSPSQAPEDIEDAEELKKLKDSELERVRKSAEGWRTGLAGLLAIITTVSVVKGRDTIIELPLWLQVVIGVVLAAALVTASVGGYLATRAAFGMPKEVTLVEGVKTVRTWRSQESRKTVQDLRRAVWLTFITLALLVLAIAITWYWPASPPALASATTKGDDKPVCGELIKGDDSALTIKEDDQHTPKRVPLTELASLSIVGSCSS